MEEIKTRKRRVNYEDAECEAFVETIKWQYPNLYKMMIHVPNGGKRGAAEAAKFKKLGVKKGFPDYVFFYPSGKFPGLIIEMKKSMEHGGSKAVVSAEQKEWIMNLRERGYAAYICEGADEALDTLKKYLRSENIMG